MSNELNFPSNQDAARALLALIDRYDEMGGNASFRSIEASVALGVGTLRRFKAIAGGADGTFNYDTLVKLFEWLKARIASIEAAPSVETKMPVTKAEFIKKLAAELETTSGQSKASVAAATAIAKAYARVVASGAPGEVIVLPDIGKLAMKTRAARTMKDPRNGDPLEVDAKRVAKFTALGPFKDALQGAI